MTALLVEFSRNKNCNVMNNTSISLTDTYISQHTGHLWGGWKSLVVFTIRYNCNRTQNRVNMW